MKCSQIVLWGVHITLLNGLLTYLVDLLLARKPVLLLLTEVVQNTPCLQVDAAEYIAQQDLQAAHSTLHEGHMLPSEPFVPNGHLRTVSTGRLHNF